MAARTCWLALGVAFYASDVGAGASARTAITVWSTPPAVAAMYGGQSYGATATPTTGAMITEQRELELGTGEVRITGIAATVDPASVQLRSLTDPSGVTVSEQRFVPGAATPDEILARHVGDTVTVATPRGEVSGALRAVDPQTLVVEVGTGDQRRLQVMRRDGYVQDVRLPAGSGIDRPSLVWRLAARKPGKHNVEVTYRADGMTWTADYLAVLDDAARTLDFSAWATIKNTTGASFDNADLTLVAAGGTPLTASLPFVQAHAQQAASRFVVPTPVHLGNGETVQVELMPSRIGAKARSVVVFEAAPDPTAGFQQYPQVDCSALTASGQTGTGHAEIAVEIDVPAAALPDGRVRLFKRKGDRLEVISEDQLRSAAGIARMRVANDPAIAGERQQLSCTTDERTRTIHEKLQVELENTGKQSVDVVVREVMWRWPVWKIDTSDESPRGVRAGPQTQEYRITLPPGGKKAVRYSVIYSW